MTRKLFTRQARLALHVVKGKKLWNHQARVAIVMITSQFGCGSDRRDLVIE